MLVLPLLRLLCDRPSDKLVSNAGACSPVIAVLSFPKPPIVEWEMVPGVAKTPGCEGSDLGRAP